MRLLDRCAFAYCKIGIRRSTANSYKVAPQIVLTLKIFFFFFFFLSKYEKHFFLKILFTQVTVCSTVTHLHHPELKSGALIQP